MNTQELIEKIENLNKLYGERHYVAIDDVLNLVSQLDKPQKPVVPQMVADIIEYYKSQCAPIIDVFEEKNLNEQYRKWLINEPNAYDIVALAWFFGYTIEKEKRYVVKVKAVLGQYLGRYYLNNEELTPQFIRTHFTENDKPPTFTRKELEEAGFGEVFDSPLFEVEEVN